MSHSDSSADAMRIWGTPRELTIPLDRSSLVQVELFGDTTKGWDASSPNNFHQVGQKLLQSEPWLLVAPHKTRIDGSITCIFKQTDAGRLNHLYSLAESLALELIGDVKPCRDKELSEAIYFSTSVKIGSTPSWLALSSGMFVQRSEEKAHRADVARFEVCAKGDVLDFSVQAAEATIVMPTLDQFIPESSIRNGWLKSKKARYHVEEDVSNVLLIPSGEPARVMFIEMINPAAHAKICNDYANDAHPHINLRLPPPFATVTAAAAAAASTRGSGSSTAGAAAGASPGFCPFVLTNRMMFAAGGEIDCAEPVAVPADCILMRMPDPEPLRQDEEKCTGIAASFYAAAAAVFAESGAVKLPASSPASSSSSSSSSSPSSVPGWKAFVDVNRRVLYKKPPVFESAMSAMSSTSDTMDDTEDHTEDDAGNTTNGTATSGAATAAAAAAAAAAAKPKKPLLKPTFGQKRRSIPGPGLASSSSGGKKKQTKTASTPAVKTPPKLGVALTGPSSSSSSSSSLAALVAPAAPGVKATATVLSFGNGSGGKKRKIDQVGAGAGAGAGASAADATVPKKKRAKKEWTPEEIEALVAKVQASIDKGGFCGKGCTVKGMQEWLKAKKVPFEPKEVKKKDGCIQKIQGAIAVAAGLGAAPAPGNAPAPVVA